MGLVEGIPTWFPRCFQSWLKPYTLFFPLPVFSLNLCSFIYNSREKRSHKFLIHLYSLHPHGLMNGLLVWERSLFERLKTSTLSVNKRSELAKSKQNLDLKTLELDSESGICVLWVDSKPGSFLALLWFSPSASLGSSFSQRYANTPRVISSQSMKEIHSQIQTYLKAIVQNLDMLSIELQGWISYQQRSQALNLVFPFWFYNCSFLSPPNLFIIF